MQYREAQRFS